MHTIDLRGSTAGTDADELARVLPRAAFDVEVAAVTVRPIFADVALRGEPAVLEYTERFDQVRPPALRVPTDVLAAAKAALADDVRAEAGPAETRVELAPSAVATQRMVPT